MKVARTETIAVATAVLAVGLAATAGCSMVTGVSRPTATGTGGGRPTSTGTATSTAPAQMFADDFRGACNGATVSRATAYAADAPSHKVILFSPYGGDVVEDTTTLPQDWMVQFDANSDAYAKVDTVVCVAAKDEQPLKECAGYQDDGHDTDNTVDLRSATYTVSMREATTGKELGSSELTSSDDTCPMFMSFDDDTQTKSYDAPPSTDDLVAFLKPFVQP